jgi:hypothetical protein
VATFVGIANLLHAERRGNIAVTRFGPVRLVGPRSERADGRSLAVIRPEHLDVAEVPDGPADAGAWRVLGRRFTGAEILYEVVAPDGERLWVEAGPAVRRLRVGDSVSLHLRDVETVAFAIGHSAASSPEGGASAPSPTPGAVAPEPSARNAPRG